MNTPATNIRILCAGATKLLWEGVRAILQKHNYCVVQEEAGNGRALIALAQKRTSDVILMEVSLTDPVAPETTYQILQQFPLMKIIALCMEEDQNTFIALQQAGVKGFLLKTSGSSELLKAIELAVQDRPYYDKKLSGQFIHFIQEAGISPFQQRGLPTFTYDELVLIQLICRELSSKEIARKMGLTYRQVENKRAEIQKKTGAQNRIGVVLYALKNGLVTLESL